MMCAPSQTWEDTMDDPLDTITSDRWRVAWLADLEAVVILRKLRIVVADPAFSRAQIAEQVTRPQSLIHPAQ